MLEFSALAVFLGIKHSFDADHLVGVSNFLPKAKSLSESASMAMSWAAGHMLTAVAVMLLLFAFSGTLLPFILGKMELLVGVMLVFVGLLGLYQSGMLHRHSHVHDGTQHSHWHLHLMDERHAHWHMFGMGVIHGLASNDELLLLLTASLGLSSALEMAGGVALFSLGVVIGMVAFSAAFTLPLIRANGARFTSLLNATVGVVSIAYGAIMLL